MPCLLFAAVMGVGLYRYVTTVPYPATGASPADDRMISLKIDPNTAEWWELTVIPGIGEVTAKKIIAFREAQRRERNLPPDTPVFQSAADLQLVKGIGPKKSKAAEPYVTFRSTPKCGRARLTESVNR